MKRSIFVLLILVTVVAALASCVPAAAPAAPAAPAAAQPAAADAANWCSNLRIAFFPGGPQGGVFANNVYNGAKQAQADLGPKVDYVFSDWDPQKMIQQFKEVAATKPDGIAVMGHPGDEAFDAIIRDAVKNGIIVTSQNTPLPIVQGEFTANGFGYVGADLYGAGASLGNEAIKRFGLKAGDRAMVWGLLSQPTRGERTKGAKEALEKAGLTVDYIEIDAATNKDPAAGTPTFVAYVSSHPDVKLVVTDHGALTATAETFLKAAGKKAGEAQHRGLRPLTRHRSGHQRRLDRPGDRSAAVAPGLPADPADLPVQDVRLLRPEHRHRQRLRRQEQHRSCGAAGREGNSVGR